MLSSYKESFYLNSLYCPLIVCDLTLYKEVEWMAIINMTWTNRQKTNLNNNAEE